MTTTESQVERDRQAIREATAAGGVGPRIRTYTRLSGPGWLQGAITLGGGSLAGSLYLGVLAGYGLMWLQPVAMVLGIIMLSAISYVTLSTGERPFDAINRQINPVLGWGWLIATMMANLVWCMPQFALGTAAVQQNLMPQVFGEQAMSDVTAKAIIIAVLFAGCLFVVWFYDSGNRGIRLFEGMLKLMVAVVVLSFFGVVVQMSLSGDGLPWGDILAGFVPDLSMLTKPSSEFSAVLAASSAPGFWSNEIVTQQQKVMITAAATAVGINMTFLLPYSMLRRGWDREFRGLAMFDLSLGLFLPFFLATSCVVIAAASQFHATPAPGFVQAEGAREPAVAPAKNLVSGYTKLLDKRLKHELGAADFDKLQDAELEFQRASLSVADKQLGAMLVKRDAFNLAEALEGLTGRGMSQYVFGIGVLGMAISSIIILMLINGFALSEMVGMPNSRTVQRLGAALAALTGASGPFLWSGDAKVWLAVPTSMFGMVLLPIAYFTFLMMMNSGKLLGEHAPRGLARVAWNLLMLLASGMAAFGSFWSIRSSPYPWVGGGCLGAFVVLAVWFHFRKRTPATP
ncbi:MAG: divalent metal cation transporter [Planctomycetaceae bacterium]